MDVNHRGTLHIDTWSDAAGFRSIKEKFCHELELGLKLYCESSQRTLPHQKTLAQRDIPLHRVKGGYGVTYISALALKLEKVWGQGAIEIASPLAAAVVTNPDFTITVSPTGGIHLQLTPTGIAHWLQGLCLQRNGEWEAQGDVRSWALAQKTTESGGDGRGWVGGKDLLPRLFQLQYAHARCCSLLRLAHREGLMSVDVVGTADWTTEETFPWLDEEGNLRLSHPAEMAVISQLAGSWDGFWDMQLGGKSASVLPLAVALSEDWLKFYAGCRIWGEVKKKNLALARARLGLVMAARQTLKLLLEKGLGVLAPLEL
uniref:DALR anticodon binding domain-containing protein n=1 Tax=Planktothricoides sp. SpSt-374 TaxID=2282167 RepID=A0A7C3ZK40_9CYAN